MKIPNETRRHPEGLAANFVFFFHLGQKTLELVYRRNEMLVFREDVFLYKFELVLEIVVAAEAQEHDAADYLLWSCDAADYLYPIGIGFDI